MRRARSNSMPTSRPHKSRYIPLLNKPPEQANDWADMKTQIASTLSRDIRRIQEAMSEGRVTSRDSMYTGLSGVALMEYHLSGMPISPQDDHLTPESLISAADKHLGRAVRHLPGYHYASNRLSFIESSVGIAVLVLTRNPLTSGGSTANGWDAAKSYLENTIDQVLAEDADDNSSSDVDDSCEVLYGRAGLLYALLYLRKEIHGKPLGEITPLERLTSDTSLSGLVNAIMTRGKHGAALLSSGVRASHNQGLPPLMWTWHGKRYLGGAHGVAGILQILLSCPISAIQKHLPDIFSTTSWLMDLQDDTDNWPTSYSIHQGFAVDNELVHWCHGATGVVILLSMALRILHDHEDAIAMDGIEHKLRQSLQLGASLVYKNGLLRKGVGLCHGVAGSVYALLAVSNALDTSSDRRFFSKAVHLAFLATLHEDLTSSDEMTIPDHPWSLYEGLAGMCCAWAEILSRLDSNDPRRSVCGFPGYNDFALD
ncbi:hypothetical protein GALMADRAFT_892453 [Galerina marginata CBS 339.88]|uniref:Lanthionine synthetase C family protein n=1 Tax=Galerina marginata (strain CBS 339.88) TaxID=685588 RepID=A0A067SJM3_GALM3|nr:hypothetical protein GALMADRAFT_892453 [Galerina marginata CBS 339.88]